MAEVIEEIIVRGRRSGGGQEPPPPRRPPAPRRPVPVGGSRGSGELRGFVPPATLPIIEEIIVTAPRTQTLVSGARIGSAGFTLAGFFAVVGGYTLAAIIDKLGDQLLTRSLRESEPIFKPSLDTPLRVIEPPPMFELIVKGVKSLLLPPLPIFISPDADPFRMIPIEPVRLPERITAPAPGVLAPAPLEIPAPSVRPLEIPSPSPRPFALPFDFPVPLPRSLPLTSPQPRALPFAQPIALPFAQPFTQPQTRPIASPGSRTAPRAIPLPRATPFADPLPMPQPRQLGNCPPCKKDKEQDEREEDRANCFRKLVKEGLRPDLDQEFEWAEIDCITGKEI